MLSDDRIVALLVGCDPLIETGTAHQTAAADSDGGQGLSIAHLPVNQVVHMRLGTAQCLRHFRDGEDAVNGWERSGTGRINRKNVRLADGG